VAIALRNTYLFAEAEAALVEGRVTQERYLEWAWQKGKFTQPGLKHRYTRLNAPELSEAILSQTKVQALSQERPAIVAIDSGEAALKSLVAPVVVGGKTIGTLQLHNVEAENTQLWREEDLALVELVLDQVGQVAENLRLFDETRQRANQEQAIREITDKFRASTNLEELVKVATETLAEHLSATHVKLRLGIPAHQTETNGHHSS
jgi:GAF domain-containing protein